MAKLQETVVRARRVAEGKVGHLRIGYMSFAAIEVMPRAVRAFRCAHPEVSVEITYIDTLGQKLALARNEIDVSFMIGPFAHHDFATLPVSADRLLAVLPNTHWLVSRPQLFLRDLAECEVILGDPVWWEATRGGGPPFRKFGPRALYRWGDPLDWAQSRLSNPMRSTSEADLA